MKVRIELGHHCRVRSSTAAAQLDQVAAQPGIVLDQIVPVKRQFSIDENDAAFATTVVRHHTYISSHEALHLPCPDPDSDHKRQDDARDQIATRSFVLEQPGTRNRSGWPEYSRRC